MIAHYGCFQDESVVIDAKRFSAVWYWHLIPNQVIQVCSWEGFFVALVVYFWCC